LSFSGHVRAARVLVTGASGFIGRALCHSLAAQGWEVTAAVRCHSVPTANSVRIRTVVVGDIDGRTDWTEALRGNTVVAHLAARAHVREDGHDALAAFLRTNRDATIALARQAAGAGLRRLVFVSTISVHGCHQSAPITERSSFAPSGPYAIAKFEAELELRHVSQQTGLGVVVVRPALVCGAGAPGNFARLLRAIARGVPLPVGGIRNARTFVQRSALVQLIVRCLVHPRAAGQAFVAADAQDISTPDLVRCLAEGMGRRARLLAIPPAVMRLAAVAAGCEAMWERLSGSLRVDASRTSAQLGWTRCSDVPGAFREIGRDFRFMKSWAGVDGKRREIVEREGQTAGRAATPRLPRLP